MTVKTWTIISPREARSQSSGQHQRLVYTGDTNMYLVHHSVLAKVHICKAEGGGGGGGE